MKRSTVEHLNFTR